MHNELFSIGPFTVYGYGLMTAIGIIAAYFLMEHLAQKKGLDKERIFWIIIWCLIFGYIGSKILYLITIIPSIKEDPSIIKRSLRDGWVMYGGLLGGILGGHLYCRLKKLNAWAYFDIGLACVALAQALGRIGCLLAGCCYGEQTECAFHIVFKESQFAPNNVPLIPTQIIMSAGDFLLFIFLLIYNRKKKKDGVVTGAYLTLYSIGRFTIEFFRGDAERGSVGPLSTSQFIAIFIAVIGIIIWIARAMSRTPLSVPEDSTDTNESSEAAENSSEKAEETQAAESSEIEETAEKDEASTDEAADKNTAEGSSDTAEEAGKDAEMTSETDGEKAAEAAAASADEPDEPESPDSNVDHADALNEAFSRIFSEEE